jgi:hypothetical protein
MQRIVIAAALGLVFGMLLFALANDPALVPKSNCYTVKGGKGVNGGGDGGSATICGKNGIAIGGQGGNGDQR